MTSVPRPPGRFIAGATCPRCGALDRLQMDRLTGERRWCVACDFDELLSMQPAAEARDDVVTILEQPVALRPAAPPQSPQKTK